MIATRPQPRPRALGFVVVLATLTAVGACAGRAVQSSPMSTAEMVTARTEIAGVLAHGARSWNAGNLDEFMSDYYPDSSTTYIGRRGVLHGVPAIRQVYASRFAPGAQRDSLHFEGLEVDVFGPDLANAIAWYVLMRGDSVTARGPTSLVMRRRDGRWRIVHDHSS